MSGPTAFAPDAFENDAFQIGVVVGVDEGQSPSYEKRFFLNLPSGIREFTNLASGDYDPNEGGPTTHPRRSTSLPSGNRRSGTGGTARPRRSDGWRRQPPG